MYKGSIYLALSLYVVKSQSNLGLPTTIFFQKESALDKGRPRDGKSVNNSTDTNFEPKDSTKSAYFATYFQLK